MEKKKTSRERERERERELEFCWWWVKEENLQLPARLFALQWHTAPWFWLHVAVDGIAARENSSSPTKKSSIHNTRLHIRETNRQTRLDTYIDTYILLMKEGSAKNCGNGEKKSETPLPQRSDPSVVSGVEASLPLSLQKTPSSLDPANTKPTHPSTLLQILKKVCEKACKVHNRHTHTEPGESFHPQIVWEVHLGWAFWWYDVWGDWMPTATSPSPSSFHSPSCYLACSMLNTQCLFNSQCFFVVVVFLPTPTHGSIIFFPPHMHKSWKKQNHARGEKESSRKEEEEEGKKKAPLAKLCRYA